MKCKNCKYFKRGKWHIIFGGGDQLSGNCAMLLEILKMNNGNLFFEDNQDLKNNHVTVVYEEKSYVMKINGKKWWSLTQDEVRLFPDELKKNFSEGFIDKKVFLSDLRKWYYLEA